MEILSVLLYYLIFSLFSLAGFAITSRISSNQLLAWGTAKLAGLILVGYLVWITSFFHLLDYQNSPALLILVGTILVLGTISSRKNLIKLIKSDSLKKIARLEVISILLYLGYLYLRSHHPAADNTEHFMDMALLNAAGKTDYFPFIDPWYAGKLVNYYYYGQYLVGLMAHLGRIPFVLAYNFALGLIFSQSTILVGLLAYELTKRIKYGILAGFLTTCAGSLFFAGCTIGKWFTDGACSYATASRLFSPSYIINELPSYSFTVGNLHAHLLGLPIFILALILIYWLATQKKPSFLTLLMLALTFATTGLTNPWDGISLAVLVIVVVSFKIVLSIKQGHFTKVREWIIALLGIGSLALILMMPQLLNFSSPVLGLGFAPSFVIAHHLSNVQYPTPLTGFLGIWGIFLAAITLSALFMRQKLKKNIFAFSLTIVSLGIIFGVELFFVKDIYSIANPSFFRANTTFKFGYDAWVMLSVIFAICLANLENSLPQKLLQKITAIVLAFLAVIAGGIYPVEAIRQYYHSQGPLTLDASQWLESTLPADADAIDFINENIKERIVIAEAVGDSYTNYGRISAFTGMIAPMGWQTHEWTWRLDAKAAKRLQPGESGETGWQEVASVAGLIEELYKTSELGRAKAIIDQLTIEYVYVGDLERSTYPDLNENKFYELGKVIFETGTSKLFYLN